MTDNRQLETLIDQLERFLAAHSRSTSIVEAITPASAFRANINKQLKKDGNAAVVLPNIPLAYHIGESYRDRKWLVTYQMFDRKTGKLTRNGVFAGLGQREYRDWSRRWRYIQMDDSYGKTRGACKHHLRDVKMIQDYESGYLSVLVCAVRAVYNGIVIGHASLGWIIEPDDSYKAEVESELKSEALKQAKKWLASIGANLDTLEIEAEEN